VIAFATAEVEHPFGRQPGEKLLENLGARGAGFPGIGAPQQEERIDGPFDACCHVISTLDDLTNNFVQEAGSVLNGGEWRALFIAALNTSFAWPPMPSI
jgi:hypothetical protein